MSHVYFSLAANPIYLPVESEYLLSEHSAGAWARKCKWKRLRLSRKQESQGSLYDLGKCTID